MQHINIPLKRVLISILDARAKRVFGEDTHVVRYVRNENAEFVDVVVKGHVVRVDIDKLFEGGDCELN